MPRTVYGAAARAAETARKQEEAKREHIQYIARIIRTEGQRQGLRTDKQIAAATGVGYKPLNNSLSGATEWRLGILMKVCDGLGLNNETRAAILGGGS